MHGYTTILILIQGPGICTSSSPFAGLTRALSLPWPLRQTVQTDRQIALEKFLSVSVAVEVSAFHGNVSGQRQQAQQRWQATKYTRILLAATTQA